MPSDENAVIRYLMDEMDPSQEVLMERAMMEDDDLLIEVESLRQTMKRLDDLPHKEPPGELTDAIIDQAAEHQKKWYHLPAVSNEMYKYAAVFLIGIGFGSGVWLMAGGEDNSGAESAKSASVEGFLPNSFQNTTAEPASVQPWIDRNNVLYYQDQFNMQSTDYKAIIEASMQKLTPLSGPPIPTFRSRNLQMTGSRQ